MDEQFYDANPDDLTDEELEAAQQELEAQIVQANAEAADYWKYQQELAAEAAAEWDRTVEFADNPPF